MLSFTKSAYEASEIGLVGFNGNTEIPKKKEAFLCILLYIHVHTTDDDEKHCVEIIIFFLDEKFEGRFTFAH